MTNTIAASSDGATSLTLVGDTVHVLFRGPAAQLMHAWLSSGGSWQMGEIQSGLVAGQHLALVSDAAGALHAAFHDSTQDILRYAYRSSAEGPWTIETVDSAPGTGKFLALTTDAMGGVHVSYQYSVGFKLRYAFRCP